MMMTNDNNDRVSDEHSGGRAPERAFCVEAIYS